MKKSILFLCLAFFSFIIFGGNVHASELNLNDFPTLDVTQFSGPYRYLIFEDTAGDYFILVTGSHSTGTPGAPVPEPYDEFTTNDDRTYFYYKALYKCYRGIWKLSSDKTTWDYVSSSQAPAGSGYLINSAVKRFVASSYNVTLSDGTVVFPEPSVENPTLAEILEGTQVVGTKTITTMKIIALCGVGCLALLIGLNLLPKILYRFL